jgi:hypothetical protein
MHARTTTQSPLAAIAVLIPGRLLVIAGLRSCKQRVQLVVSLTLHNTHIQQSIIKGCLSQPLLLIAAYFGESVAFYFAWMGFYTK